MADEKKEDDAASRELAAVEAQITEVAAEVAEVKGKITRVEAALSEGGGYLGITEGADLVKRLEALEKKEDRLRENNNELQRQKTSLLARQQPAAPDVLAKLEAKLDEVRESVDSLRPDAAVSVSKANSTIVRDLLRRTGLSSQHCPERDFIQGIEDIEDVDPFPGWLDKREDHPDNKDRCRTYLQKVIELPSDGDVMWYDAQRSVGLLDLGTDDGLGKTFRGTTDWCIINKGGEASPWNSLRVLIELKKEKAEDSLAQAQTELLLANTAAKSRHFKPIVLLTDLISDKWTLLWINNTVVYQVTAAKKYVVNRILGVLSEEKLQEGDGGLFEAVWSRDGAAANPLSKRRKVEVSNLALTAARLQQFGTEEYRAAFVSHVMEAGLAPAWSTTPSYFA